MGWVKHVVAIFILVMIFVLYSFYEHPLHEASIDLIKQLQTNHTGPLGVFFVIITYLADLRIYIVIILLIFWLDLRDSSIYFMINFSFFVLITGILRIIYRKPRPYMEDLYIKPYNCSGEYGTPSGHAFFSAYLPTILALYYINSSTRLNTLRSPKLSKLIYFCLFIYTIIISISRVIDGVHTLDQVFLGLQIGWFCAFYIHVNMKNMMINHINQFVLGDQTARDEVWKHFILVLIIFLILYSFFMVPYVVIKYTYETPLEWRETLLDQPACK